MRHEPLPAPRLILPKGLGARDGLVGCSSSKSLRFLLLTFGTSILVGLSATSIHFELSGIPTDPVANTLLVIASSGVFALALWFVSSMFPRPEALSLPQLFLAGFWAFHGIGALATTTSTHTIVWLHTLGSLLFLVSGMALAYRTMSTSSIGRTPWVESSDALPRLTLAGTLALLLGSVGVLVYYYVLAGGAPFVGCVVGLGIGWGG